MNSGQRDDPMDRLLRRALARTGDAAGDACPPADVLAAYVERSLTSEEAGAFESHAASCANCQQALALLAEMPANETGSASGLAAGAAQPDAAPWWHWRWLVPIAAAAALTLAVYVAIRPQPAPTSQMAGRTEQDVEAAFEAVAPQVAPAPPATPAPEGPERDGAPGSAPAAVPGAGLTEFRRKSGATEFPGPTASNAIASSEAPAGTRAVAGRPPMPASPAATVRGGTAAAAAAAPVAKSTAQAPAEAEAYAPAPRAAEPAVVADAARPQAAELTAQAAPAPVPAAPDVAVGAAAGAAAPGRVLERTAATRQVMWRAGPRGLIERTSDAGRTWQAQGVEVSVDLLAAATVSPRVAWVVGASGTVLVTVDGQRWQARAFPEPVDLVAVSAGSDTHATVTARDGRRFGTTDGGRTWRPLP